MKRSFLVILAALVLVAACQTPPVPESSQGPGNGTSSGSSEPDSSASPLPGATFLPPEPAANQRGNKVWRVQVVDTTWPDGVLSAHFRSTFDTAGRLVLEEYFNGSMELEMQRQFSYRDQQVEVTVKNASGTILGISLRTYRGALLVREEHYNARRELQLSEDYTWNAAGQRLSWSIQPANGSATRSEYRYENGRLSEVQVLTANNTMIRRYVRSYDPAGNLLREDEIDGDGAVIARTAWIRDQGLVIREERQNAAGDVQSAQLYRYDAAGNPIEIRQMDRRGKLLETRTQVWKSFDVATGGK